MHARQMVLLAAVLLGAAVPLFVADGGTAESCTAPVQSVENVSTGAASEMAGTDVMVEGRARVGDTYEFTAWFEYRPLGAGDDWRTTDRTAVEVDVCGRGWFETPLTDLSPNTTYEYRAVAAAGNETARGAVRTFTINSTANGTTPTTARTATRTPTLAPCAQYRGGGSSLCTGTPTPTDPPVDGDTDAPNPMDDEVTPPSQRSTGGPDGWLTGMVPLLGWVAAVVVVAPVVLGGLLWVDSLWGRAG